MDGQVKRGKSLEIRLAEIACCGIIFAYFGLNYVIEAFEIPTIIVALPFYALLCYKIIKTKYTKREIGIGIILAMVAIIVSFQIREVTLITNLLILFSLKNIDIPKLLKPLLWSALAGCLLVFISSFADIGLDISITKDYGRGMVETRYCFGYPHPNPFHMYMVRLMSLFVGAYYEKIGWKHLLILSAFNLFIYSLSASRTSVLCGFWLIFLVGVYRYGEKIIITKMWKRMILVCFYGIIVLALISVLFWEKIPALTYINELLTGRIELASWAVQNTGFSLFGKRISNEFACDNGIINMLLSYGIVTSFIYTGMMGYLLVKSQKWNEPFLTIILMVCVVYAFAEAVFLEKIFRNIPMMYMSWLIFGRYPAKSESVGK